MATVRLTRREAEHGNLPAACMCCGEPTTLWKTKKFSWQPSWVIATVMAGLLPYVIVSLILTKRMTVRVPLCADHQNHWFKRVAFNLCYLIFIVGLLVGSFAIPELLDVSLQTRDAITGAICIGTVVTLLAWVVINIIVEARMVGVKEITDCGITLKNVHLRFFDAVQRWRDGEDEEDETPRRLPSVLPADAPEQVYDPNRRRGEKDRC
jgi:hypothetical protein